MSDAKINLFFKKSQFFIIFLKKITFPVSCIDKFSHPLPPPLVLVGSKNSQGRAINSEPLASFTVVMKKFLKLFLLVWFIGFSFHNSCILFLPMYWVPIKKLNRQKVIYIMIVALLIGLSPIPQGLFASYGEVDVTRKNVEGYEGF